MFPLLINNSAAETHQFPKLKQNVAAHPYSTACHAEARSIYLRTVLLVAAIAYLKVTTPLPCRPPPPRHLPVTLPPLWK